MLHTNSIARAIAIPLLRTLQCDITIRHHYVPSARIKLNVYRHKGYWYHGKDREKASIALMRRLIARGDCVFDVGAHIGYFSMIYADCVGPGGRVYAFEPGSNNLPYTRANLLPLSQAQVVEKAVTSRNGTATLYMEDITGQNNSLLRHYDIFEANARSAFAAAHTVPIEVETVSLDAYAATIGARPAFVKVDVEGAECEVLAGMQGLLRDARPYLLVEVNHDHRRTISIMRDHGYTITDAQGTPLDHASIGGLQNIFATPGERWAEWRRTIEA